MGLIPMEEIFQGAKMTGPEEEDDIEARPTEPQPDREIEVEDL